MGNPDSGSEPEEPKPSPSGGTITLEPPNIEVQVGTNVHVMVIVRDGNGLEAPSENISVSIIDKTLVRLVEIDNRIPHVRRARGGRDVRHHQRLGASGIARRQSSSLKSEFWPPQVDCAAPVHPDGVGLEKRREPDRGVGRSDLAERFRGFSKSSHTQDGVGARC